MTFDKLYIVIYKINVKLKKNKHCYPIDRLNYM